MAGKMSLDKGKPTKVLTVKDSGLEQPAPSLNLAFPLQCLSSVFQVHYLRRELSPDCMNTTHTYA